jgi:hypothetical protein
MVLLPGPFDALLGPRQALKAFRSRGWLAAGALTLTVPQRAAARAGSIAIT